MRLAAGVVSAVVVPLCAVLGYEFWGLTTSMRYPVSPADPSAKMRAVVYSTHGATRDVLKVDEARAQPLQPAAPGFVVIKVVAAALNPVDFKQLRNDQPEAIVPKPRIAGFDVSGVVLSAGEGTPFKKGDAVYGMLPILASPWGSLAEVTAADARCFAKAPTSIPLEEAAALPLVGLTVLQVMKQAGIESDWRNSRKARQDKKMLVHAAAGGVGSFAVQYAKALGFEVIATCSAQNAERVRGLGATETIDYRTQAFEKVVQASGGVDFVVDPMSWSYMRRTLDTEGVLRPSARYCHILSTDWEANDMEQSILAVLQGPYEKWRSRAAHALNPSAPRIFSTPVQPDAEGLAEIARIVDEGYVRPVIDRYFDLDSAVEAFEYLETGHARGKVVVRVGSSTTA